MLTISHLTKTFGGKTAVDDLSLHIAPGEICGFIRHNGAGTPAPMFTGIASTTAYALILAAMQFVTSVTYIQAFRQLSLPIGVFAGVFLLHERCPLPKIVGTALIVAGLFLVAFG